VPRIAPCSALGTPHRLRIAPPATLGAPRRSWIAPFPASCPYTTRRLLHVSHLAFHDGLRIAPYSDTSRPRVVYGLLRARHLSPAPAMDCSMFDTWCFVPITDISVLLTPHPALFADASAFNASELCTGLVVLRSRHLSLRPVLGLLQVRHLAVCSVCGLLRTLHLSPYVSRGSLRD